MPELPEVEQVRSSLARRIVGLRVLAVTVHRRDVVTGPDDPPGGWSRASADRRGGPKPRIDRSMLLEGSHIVEIARRGKQLAVMGDRGAMVVHLGMTGQLLFRGRGERLMKPDHVHVTWKLVGSGGEPAGKLVFRDPRRFGGVWAHQGPSEVAEHRWAALGPDALTVEAGDLAERLKPRRVGVQTVRNVKSALLDQTTLAGVGNIYADEAMFRAGILPTRLVDGLSGRDVEILTKAIREVLQEAVASGGSTLRDYVDGEGVSGSFQSRHRVYGRSGQMCITCASPLESGLVAQRTTVWCPACQC